MGKIISTMTGRTFSFLDYNLSDLEHCRNWLIERGLMAHVDKDNWNVVITGRVNGKWKEDVDGNLFKIDN